MISGNVATGTTPSGVTVTATVTAPAEFVVADTGSLLIEGTNQPSYIPTVTSALWVQVPGGTTCTQCGSITYQFSSPVSSPTPDVGDIGAGEGVSGGSWFEFLDHPISLASGTFGLDSAASEMPNTAIQNDGTAIGFTDPTAIVGAPYPNEGASCGDFGCGAVDITTSTPTITSETFNFGYDGIGTDLLDYWSMLLGATPAALTTVDLSVTKTASSSTWLPGQPLSYQVLVSNSGSDTASGVTVSDPLPAALQDGGFTWTCGATSGSSCAAFGSGDINDAVNIAPGGTLTYTVTGTVPGTASGAFGNTATVTPAAGVTDPGCSPSCSSTAIVSPAAVNAALTITKIATASTGDSAPLTLGESVAYSYYVTNTGNVALTSVGVSDLTGGPVTCPTAPLAPGQSETCVANQATIVTQGEVNAGQLVDTATASGTEPNGTTITSAPSTVTLPSNPAPQVKIQKAGTVSPVKDQASAKVGDKIGYTYVVTNVGNVDLTSVSVSDPTIGTVACPTPAAPGLAPGSSETCAATATHTVTQAEVDAGSVTDTATATGTDAAGTTSPVSDPSTATIATQADAPQVALKKTAVVAPKTDQAHALVGDKISYRYKVANIGNVDLKSVSVSDPSIGRVICPKAASSGLVPGRFVTCHSARSVTVTQKDLNAGGVVDVATATGIDTRGQKSPASNQSKATVLVEGAVPPETPAA